MRHEYTDKVIKNGIEYTRRMMPCPCMCHRNPHIKHIAPCCNDGWIEYLSLPDMPPKHKDETQLPDNSVGNIS